VDVDHASKHTAKSLTLQYLASSYFPCWPLEVKLQKLIITLKHSPCFPLAGRTDDSHPKRVPLVESMSQCLHFGIGESILTLKKERKKKSPLTYLCLFTVKLCG